MWQERLRLGEAVLEDPIGELNADDVGERAVDAQPPVVRMDERITAEVAAFDAPLKGDVEWDVEGKANDLPRGLGFAYGN